MGTNFLFAGGGSGGHLFPGMAVAHFVQRIEPRASVLFCTTEKPIDEEILTDGAWDWMPQPVTPVPRNPVHWWRFYRDWRTSLRLCRELVREEKIAAVLGLGGYASGPALKVASELGIPAAMLNPDAVPGKANRWAAKYCGRIFTQFAGTTDAFGKYGKKCRHTGCPVRPEIIEAQRGRALRHLELEETKNTLVVMGGSLGGHNVNVAAQTCLIDLHRQGVLFDWQVIHITGKTDHQPIMISYDQAETPVKVLDFTKEMSQVLACADLMVCRAGASTLAELMARGIPALLLPYPYHRDQHQLINARCLADAGAARIVKDTRDAVQTANLLQPVLRECLQNREVRRQMVASARQIARPQAASEIAQELLRLVQK